MSNLQETYNRLTQNKEELKRIKEILKEAYEQEPAYVDLQEKIKELVKRRKVLVTGLNEMHTKEIAELEQLRVEIRADQMLLQDIILAKYMKGENVEVQDKFKQPQLPLFTIKFVKAS